MNSSYITSAQTAQQLPAPGAPELAFIGRSNCGKSSLLNALLGRTNLARTSSTPGRTQMVNFFAVEKGERKVILADLPGYGYSSTGREVRKHWQDLIAGYLARPCVRGFLFLMDIRRAEDLNDEDLRQIAGLAQRRPPVPVTVILTKADKVNNSEAASIEKQLAQVLKKEGIKVAAIRAVSSLKKKGIEPLKESLLAPLLD